MSCSCPGGPAATCACGPSTTPTTGVAYPIVPVAPPVPFAPPGNQSPFSLVSTPSSGWSRPARSNFRALHRSFQEDSAMVIAFCNNQVIVSAVSTTNTIYTDPVPLDGNDRATCHLQTEYVINAQAGTGLTYLAQVSNDGTNWADTTLTDNATAAGLRYLSGAAHLA